MKIVYLAAGAAGMYCGSCLHDNALATGLLEAGHDVLLVPTYTPLRTDEPDMSRAPVLLGGINVYLQQFSPLFGYLPRSIHRWLDSPRLLDWLSRWQFSVQAQKLGRLTVSILAGEEGRLRKEVDHLVDWLVSQEKPDVVHLSNAMFCGLAGEIGRRLGVPVVATLSGEDIFLEKLPEPYYSQARQLLRERAADVTAFVALNAYYADHMADYLGVERRRIHVIPHGLKLAGHAARVRAANEPLTVGFLARICSDKGLHNLLDAARILAADGDLPPVHFRAAGYLGAADRKYLADLQAKANAWGLGERFEYLGEVTRDEKIRFLHSLDIMSLPTVYRESKGLPVLEALANAVPVVLPAHGTFPELVADTQGGLLHEPENPADLAAKLKQLLLDSNQRDELGRRGHAAVHARYSDQIMAERTATFYHHVLAEHATPHSPRREPLGRTTFPSPQSQLPRP